MSNANVPLFHFLLLGAAIAAAATSAEAQSQDAGSLRRGGVSISVDYLRDRAVFCINADESHKISAEYGVEFRIPKKDMRLWSDKFPKVVTGEGRYFSLPLQVDLLTRGDVVGRRVTAELGACSSETLCNNITFDLTVPRNTRSGEQRTARCDHR